MPSVSKKQRRLLGYAYAYAKGKAKNAPESIKDVAKSFMKKGKKKGLKNLRDFAKTKESNLPLKVESIITSFEDFKYQP